MDENIVAEEQVQQVALQSEPQTNEVVSQEVVASAVTVGVDVDKTLYDAEEFLANFAGLRLENDQLKRSNEELQQQLEKARHDLQQMQLEKSSLEAVLIKEREQHKEALWKVKSEFQKIQEERLQWKEKYLNICMRNGNTTEPIQPGRKRKLLTAENENEEFYTNLAATFGLAGQEEQPEEIVLTLVSEQSKSYRISIRECPHCGVGFCSSFGLREHLKNCEQRKATLESQQGDAVGEGGSIISDVTTLTHTVAHGGYHRCELCKVDFATESDLIQHNQYHQGTHKYLCRKCYRAYQSNPGRLKHEQLEHGAVPVLICDICGKQFKRKDRLKDHFATKHSLATPHECPFCDAAYKLRDYLRKHVNTMHPGKMLQHANAVMKESDMEIQMEVESEEAAEVVAAADVLKEHNGETETHVLAEVLESEVVVAEIDSKT
ncbi:zinc finger protein 853-like isoform X3 [Clytia hemisphaerica]|uniref:C2H2-type domain-containing protein n=1 Tax=Clytia hemisphaerica TaxID=252671 RepID=A0A7M5XA75_9CNID